MAVNGIGDFVTSLKETRRLAAQIVIEIKGEAAGHPFRGNQWEGGSGGFEKAGSISEDEYLKQNPHSHTFGSTVDARIEKFRQLPDDAEVIVFHATDEATANNILKHGVKAGEKRDTSTGTERFGPGQGLGSGVYVGTDPMNVSGYGNRILAVKVRKSQIEASPEQKKFGAHVDAAKALTVSDAIINSDIPASSFIDVTPAGKYSRAHDAIVYATGSKT